MALDGIHVIDVDTHLTEPFDLWTSRAPKGWEDRVPRVVERDGAATWVIGDVPLGRAGSHTVVRRDGGKSKGMEFFGWRPDDIHRAAYDMDARLEVMDDLGIHAQVLYPNIAGFGSQRFGEIRDEELRRLLVTIYNDAMAEIQERSNGRLFPMALIPWWDVEGSVAEVERARGLGLRGVNTCSDPQNVGLPDLGDRCWDPLWEACEAQGMPVNFHIGASDTAMSWFGTSPWPSHPDDRKLAIGSAMMYLSNARVLANLIFSGVLERHPGLRVVSVESGIGWIPFVLDSLDYQLTETAPGAVEELSLKPSGGIL